MSQSTTLKPYGAAGIGILAAPAVAMKRLYAGYLAWRMEQSAIAGLRSMSDRALRDIGLTRGEIDDAVRGGGRARGRAFVPEC